MICSRCPRAAVQVVQGRFSSGGHVDDSRCWQHRVDPSEVGNRLIYLPTNGHYQVVGVVDGVPQQLDLAGGSAYRP